MKINPTGEDPIWTLYQPDGGRVTLDLAGVERIYDRNDNFVQVESISNYNGTGHEATKLSDQLGREIVIENDATTDQD